MSEKAGPVVLCIEDEATIAGVIRDALSFGGFKVLTAETAAEALEIAQSRPIDLILLDLILPDVDGYSFFELLREGELTSIPVVIVSGCTSSEARDLGLRLGARDYITKPFSVVDLISRVKRVMDVNQPKKRTARSARS